MLYSLAMQSIFHITTKSEWDRALRIGIYDQSTRGKSFDEVGFIHASTIDQLQDVARFIYGKSKLEIVVLEFDIGSLEARGIKVIFEDGGNGQVYPHIYSKVPIEMIVKIHSKEIQPEG